MPRKPILKRLLKRTLIAIIAGYIIICTAVYFFQEKMIFFPEKLGRSFTFSFPQKFEELHIKAQDGTLLNGVLFKCGSPSKGVIFYLHGNAGSINSWGNISKTYTDLGYDVFMLDYRGYGKSEGDIQSQTQLFSDIQTAYDTIKKRYDENNIVVLGYSIGTGPAAEVASTNHPKLLILQAPYYSLTDMMRHNYPILPTFILKYKLETGEYIKQCHMPIVIFHGDADEVIYYGSSLKLKPLLKPTDTLITLQGQQHNGMSNNPDYQAAIIKILAR